MKLLMVSVGQGRYAVAAEAVERIIDPALEPGFQEDLQTGETRDHEVRYPVFNLHEVAGEQPGQTCVYVLIGTPSGRAVVRVDSADAIRDVPAASIAPLPAFIFEASRRLFRGVFPDDRGPRLLLNESAIP
jgi:chemotaxis protein histidine kinase CheA